MVVITTVWLETLGCRQLDLFYSLFYSLGVWRFSVIGASVSSQRLS